ncbi:bacteriohemerythrin [Pelosinus sp. UFO1]|uniref:bacteriohemerythrin n=1 Tax=Pelosinus sp. UFO1 TaxID=484770 RepID=UPI0004D1D6D0|nr:bacteriohemerythrin [Pelosinus sp. UFO1]AIF52179.1 hemerythrin-like metal-binding protein [Pelosinus sp. UFO1]
MVFWKWEDAYLTNISRFDKHHQKLAGLINQLYTDVFECEDMNRKQLLIKNSLDELIDYTYYHFIAEEELMIKHKYPDYVAHKEDHDQFKMEINKLMERHKDNTLIWTIPIFQFLQDWITFHILNSDKKYAPFLINRM